MVKCWASSLRGCCDEQSAEHTVSRGFFSGPMVTISGLPWLKGESKEISVSNLTAKILCRTHNTALSRLDLESKRFRRTIEKIDAEQNRLKKKVFRWDPSITHDISGPLLERWVAKTCVNLF